MNELIAGLMLVFSNLSGLPVPDATPTVKEVSREEIVYKACGDTPEACKDLYFYTDPLNGEILVTSGIEWKYTFAQAELLMELGRYTLSHNGYYRLENSCEVNAKLEAALEQVRWDYIKHQAQEGKYVGEGFPQLKDMPHHRFYCGAPKLDELKI